MEALFIEFRDPLFGVIVFFTLVFIVATFSYWWGRHKIKEDDRALERFAKQFHRLSGETELKALIQSGGLSEKSWLLLAHAYEKGGDFEKAIEIYQNLIEQRRGGGTRPDIMLLLGQIYLKAGFLERSKEIFMQILQVHPRTPQALQALLLVYEQLRQFHKAIEVLEPLEELGVDVRKEKLYLQVRALLSASGDVREKALRLVDEFGSQRSLSYLAYEYLFAHAPDLAWRYLDQSQCGRIADLLWRLEEGALDLDIIASNGYLRELFSARGVVDLASSSEVFEFDVLIKLRRGSERGATLQFEYLCRECKQVFPFAFHRCPSCRAIDSVVAEPILTKEFFESNHSFL
ncbi:MAG: tetratricopeptide repeat protein [Campylobacterales bacterium]|nr:tetratricopeptide repeat protein [Campylobacterales bacterium]